MSSNSMTVRSREEVVEALKRIRLERDWTYDQLAEQACVSRRNLIRLMTTDSSIRDRTLFKLSRYVDEQLG
jgi:transcriptional regulator with XRE-family HTH domain